MFDVFRPESSPLPPFHRRLAIRGAIAMAPVLPLAAWWGSRRFAPLPEWLADHMSYSMLSLPTAVVTGVGVSLAALRSESLRQSAVRVACMAGLIAASATTAVALPLETEVGYSSVGSPAEDAVGFEPQHKNQADPTDGLVAVLIATGGAMAIARRPRPEEVSPTQQQG